MGGGCRHGTGREIAKVCMSWRSQHAYPSRRLPWHCRSRYALAHRRKRRTAYNARPNHAVRACRYLACTRRTRRHCSGRMWAEEAEGRLAAREAPAVRAARRAGAVKAMVTRAVTRAAVGRGACWEA